MICTDCLLLTPLPSPVGDSNTDAGSTGLTESGAGTGDLDPTEAIHTVEFDPLPFPSGEGGVAVAIAVGLLDSLTLNRPAIEACVEHAEANGADVFLTLDRLADTDVNPTFDPSRRRAQLENLL